MGLEATVLSPVDEQRDLANALETNRASGRVAEFWAFVAENSEVIVESPRLPGVEMPFGALMTMCAVTVTEQNVDKFYAESYALLAAAKSKTKEPEEETDEAGEEPPQPAEPEEEAKKTKLEAGNNQQLQASGSKEEIKIEDTKETDKPATAKASNTVFANEAFSWEQSDRAESAPGEIVEGVEPASTNQATSSPTVIPEGAVAAGNNLMPSKTGETIPAITSAVTTEESDSIRTDATDPMSGAVATARGVTIEQRTVDTDVETLELERTTDSLSENEELIIPSGDDSADEDLFAEERPLPESLKNSGNSDIETSEDYILLAEEDRTFTFAEYTPEDSNTTSIAPELSLPVEEVEKTVTLVADRIEELEEEGAEELHQLLNQIAQQTEEANYVSEGDIEEPEADSENEKIENLRELFIQLFDQLEIDYTPELVESFVQLSLKDNLSELIDLHEEVSITNDRGTHEVIRQLLVAVNYIKRAALYAYQLGRSALCLYSRNSATSFKMPGLS
jgi:hypothetical protein